MSNLTWRDVDEAVDKFADAMLKRHAEDRRKIRENAGREALYTFRRRVRLICNAVLGNVDDYLTDEVPDVQAAREELQRAIDELTEL